MLRFPVTELLNEQKCYDFLLNLLHPNGLHQGVDSVPSDRLKNHATFIQLVEVEKANFLLDNID